MHLNWIVLRKLRLFPGKVILSFHGGDIRPAHGLYSWMRFAYRYLLRQADVVVCCSKDLQSEVVALEPRVNTCVIYNGNDEGRFGRMVGTTILQGQLEQKALTLNIGKYEFRKAHDLILRAFARVLEERPEIEKTKATVANSGLTEHALYGPFHQLPEYLFFRRAHTLQSTAQHLDRQGRTRWFAPTKLGKIVFPHFRQFREHLRIIGRVPLPLDEKLFCYASMVKWLLVNRKRLSADLTIVIKDLLRPFVKALGN
jgi:glycosyltransferase involved in cell wall biosynthesis